MDKCRINIAVIEPSDMVCEGLTNLLLKNESHFYVFKIAGLDELEFYCKKEKIDTVIINPILLINRINDFLRLKKTLTTISWIGLIYSYFENDIVSKFDELLSIGDSADLIIKKINRTIDKCSCHDSQQEELSEREKDVLVQLAKGLSNKEIADKLNISVHTVISHRKNIIEKTGIKSLPGLTIYAILKKIIPLGSL